MNLTIDKLVIGLIVLIAIAFGIGFISDVKAGFDKSFAPYNNGQTMDYGKKNSNGKGYVESVFDGTFTSGIGN